jgi:ribonuclease T2
MSTLHKPIARFIAACAVICCAALSHALPAMARGEMPGRFDHYVLSLSWSPTYCASDQRNHERDALQCNSERPYAFVVHGLWPQYDQGYPEFCSTRDRWVPNRVIDSMIDIMPSKGLIIHEWRRHGSCSGLSQSDYFGLVRSLYSGLAIPYRYRAPDRDILTSPAELKADFLEANPQLDESMLHIYCGSRNNRARLSEVRICFNKQGKPTACGNSDHRRQCRAKTLVVPAVRSR